VQAIGPHGVTDGFAGFSIDRPDVLEELVPTGDDLITAR
jgi:hypothetical protein